MADLLAQQCRRAQLCLQYSESTGIAHRGNKFRAGEIGSHRRGNDGGVNPKSLTKTCCQHDPLTDGFRVQAPT